MNSYLKQLNLSKEEEILSSRIDDAFSICDRKSIPRFVGFLDLRQQKIAEITACANRQSNYMFFGGYQNAERKMFGVFPDYIDDKENFFPIGYLEIGHLRPLSHRDFLGSLMSLGIKREVIGDILVGENKSFIILQSSFCSHIIDNLKKIANVGVSIKECDANSLVLSENRFIEEKVIVSSLRLDCIVSAICNKSRAESAKFIESERVFINHEIVSSCSKNVEEGNVISVRSIGKFEIGQILSTTKKGRLVLSYKKYI